VSNRAERLATIVKAYDIRGLVPSQLDEPTAAALGAGFAALLQAEDPSTARIVVGRDMRESGSGLAAAFTASVLVAGIDVVDLGLISTDMLYFASGRLDAPGVVFTASHNPAGYNGLKLCRAGAGPIGDDTGLQEIKRLALADHPPASAPGTATSVDVLGDFVEHVHGFVELDALRPLKVVADTANGMGGLVVPAAFDGLPFDLEILYPELDGSFPNHPADPIQPANQQDLRKRVLETGADVGVAFDGDADRAFIVDEQAEPVPGSTTTALVADAILREEPGATILYNLICSKAVPEVVKELGGTPVRTRVGHSFIKQQMAETGAAFAGEHSGHYYFRDNFRADSGLITALVVLEQMGKSGRPLSEMRRPYERYAASGEINFEVTDQAEVLTRVAAAFPDAAVDHLDGMTVDMGPWWFNLRPSNTEPLLRLNLEAPNIDDCAIRVEQLRSLVEGGS
jgi:phosphomannomutase